MKRTYLIARMRLISRTTLKIENFFYIWKSIDFDKFSDVTKTLV